MGMDLDLRRIRFFVEVIRQGGFTPAGRVLFATQPTVSKAIKQLESELGVVLLHRQGTRCELTEAGHLVYQHGLRLLAASGALTAELDELKGLRSGRLAIGFPRMGTTALFAPALGAFKRSHPGIDVDVTVHAVSDLHRHLASSALEVAALFEPGGPELAFAEAREEDLLLVVAASHPLAGRNSVDLRELAGLPLVLFEEGMPAGDAILRACGEAGFVPTIAARTGQLELLFELVASGVGAAFVPRAFVASRLHAACLSVPVRQRLPAWRIGFAWLRERELSFAARAWLELAVSGQYRAG